MLKKSALQKYSSLLDIKETEIAIKAIKDYFERKLAEELNLTRVSAPLFVKSNSGLNDDLSGKEQPVSFAVPATGGQYFEIVHSLAKWKRMALARYGFKVGEGLYTDMNAIRKDENLSNLHSIYVDQWDWEKIITPEQRNKDTLKMTVRKIYKVFKSTEVFITNLYPQIKPTLPEEIFFITSQELENLYPHLSPKDREHAIAKEKGAVFLMEIGDTLKSGIKHDDRAPDYDDWKLNGDILFWYPVLNCSVELSSMGIRVDKNTLVEQLKKSGKTERLNLDYHQKLLQDKLPLTMGGGIGQSRICLFFLKKIHIGEVQASIWPEEIIKECERLGIQLL
ncbi:aspartate-ammonia ligase [Anaerobranca californiensis DSM 14826]|jgi:aspartate--ammonia ligase|uniref:Aspartate--ammonia ligase n=1 Tax=Anaerobranca californiensis DSM 14826 TaxID=1120989 RepID=A0A1M6QWS9_9FIRM|nr:aspartate--ammonia ligase [Anaerobranca californiensis]SHK24573.1 aspartate-ammonia ligase [Anaerobranca californiensis DSM 14826]